MAQSAGKEVDMSTYTEGQVHQLVEKLESEGFTADHITKLGQCSRLADVRAFLEGKAEIVIRKTEKTIVSIFTLVKVVILSAIVGKKTKDCFTDKSRYYYRDSDLDAWLPKNQPDQSEGKFSVQQLTQNATFKQAVESFLNTTGDIPTLARLLKERDCLTTLPTIESLIERQEAGEDVGLLTNGYANFFFVEGKNGSVSVVHASRYDDGQWYVYVYPLDFDSLWDADRRFFFCNTDTVSL